MAEFFDMVIRRARIRGSYDRLVDIAIDRGLIVYVGESVHGRGGIEIDAGGNLVTEAYANPHIHLCKVYTFTMIGDAAVKLYQGGAMGGSMIAIDVAGRVKEAYREDMIYENARRAAMESLRFGGLYMRAFADTDSRAKLEGVKALLRLKGELEGVMDIQVVAFPQEGVVRDPGALEYVEKALEMGADVVGGIPWIEGSSELEDEHISRIFDLAKRYNKDVAMLTDDAGDPSLRTTFKLAYRALREGWVGRVVACHARALATYAEPSIIKISELARAAKMSFTMAPHTGPLYIPFKKMLSLGVNIALGQDDVADAYYPFGRNNMLEVAFLAGHVTRSMGLDDLETLMDMITWRAKIAMNIEPCGVKPGCPADLVVNRGSSAYEAIWRHEPPLYVIRRGRIVAENSIETKIHVPKYTGWI